MVFFIVLGIGQFKLNACMFIHEFAKQCFAIGKTIIT